MQESSYTVLLLGEESYNRQLLADGLCQRGYQVIKARSASEADRALTVKPEIVVVDQRVRGTNGLAWIRRMRECGHTMPVVFCSATSCSPKTFNVLRNLLNVALIVRKPLQPLVLIDQMEHLLPISAKGVPFSSSSDSSSDSHDILQFSPPSESEQETCLTEFDEEQETRRALEELGREYLSEMPEILYELRSQVAEAMAAEECLPLLLTATTTAHQIRGTAGSLGFPELSRLAGGIEDKLRGFKSDGTASDRQPMARALMLVADIEAWLEAWQDHNQDCMDSGLAGPALEPAPLALVCEDPLANILTPIKTLGESAPRAFIVDKNSERVQSLANVLRAHGNWQVETLTGGVRVLGALEECQPELLILEGVGDGDGAGDTAGMELSGFAICRMIRCHPKWALLPIIIIIADTGIDSRRAVYQAGANDFIVTPLVEEELTNRLLAFLQTHSG